jgi:cob(I)alamin adenosyltransferase
MPRLTRIYTRTGDDGTTALGAGQRTPKTAPRIEAYGTVDELNAQIGAVLAAGPVEALREPLRRMQNDLFHAGADLCIPDQDKPAAPGPRIEPRHVQALEQLIDRLNADLPPLENFVLPGGSPAATHLHVARTVCRRAEREVLRLRESEPVSDDLVRYLNRLSDALFVMARFENHARGVAEPTWNSRA